MFLQENTLLMLDSLMFVQYFFLFYLFIILWVKKSKVSLYSLEFELVLHSHNDWLFYIKLEMQSG